MPQGEGEFLGVLDRERLVPLWPGLAPEGKFAADEPEAFSLTRPSPAGRGQVRIHSVRNPAKRVPELAFG
jgi:hypothetical protein